MPIIDEKHVKVCRCIVLRDSMTEPDTNESGVKHSFKVAVRPDNPDIALLEQLANAQLAAGVFAGILPANGTMPVGTLGPSEYDGQFNGWRVFRAGTYRGVPPIYAEDGRKLDYMQIAPSIYSGQIVDLLLHCYENNGKVKGVAVGLDAFAVVSSANAQRQHFGGSGVDTAAAFGGQPHQQAPQQNPNPNQYQQAPQQNPNQQAPQQNHGFIPQGQQGQQGAEGDFDDDIPF